ncbi:sulfotransferase [candidate division KSB3 bacterium]|uniref:Sulfotransferase n=1 Tax=candidate division KSB3 bacterium TaxID=2044937 RepID=A0A2G6E8X8_9BACT|nr:MAG: sulfotransferase [candidate division KSB3 bacterium]PIE30617.1 MAG: sulfotransferase [candidate division KSB3 bacterium]
MKKNFGRILEQGKRRYRLYTAKMRLLPDFVIIGAQKCGTTFLHQLLQKHPCVRAAPGKAVHYFDCHFQEGMNWYRAHFPYRMEKVYEQYLKKRPMLTGESSPYYLFHPHAARRMAATVPNVKLIALLRNPVDRAYSHYNHERRKGREELSFEEAIAAEEQRLDGERDKMLEDQSYESVHHLRHSYVQRGIYVDQLQAFAEVFESTRFFIIHSEELYEQPLQVFGELLEFLDLPPWVPGDIRPVHVGSYQTMNAETRKQLQEFFEPHNQRLYSYLGRDFGW